ncbi:ATP-dependent DNA ligase [Rhodohalobacter sp.]|uniref:ATP-dependent DNA ligase n=1 Tax=Rhodohalobacter sp. TaxID=1974210 RepID=UPI002ACDEA4B|nr:ATP-dependent DNA ligase [Rhodohalobacter sp.]MDZ7758486.1 ATP-dependent DNA ligase [Rhodohalobacter sp.]
MSTSFFELCSTIQQIRETRGTNAKITILADFLSDIDTAEDLELAAQFIGEGAFSAISGKRASVGSRTTGLAASEFCEIDYDNVYKPCRTATGSNSEAIERLLQNIPEAIEKRDPVSLSLQEMSGLFHDLLEVSSRVDKIELLQKMWRKMHPVEVKYSIRMLGQGSLRIGFETRSVIASIAKAFGYKKESVRYAHMIMGSIGKTAVLAKENRLDEAEFKLFHPLSFMLASPIESRSVDTLSDYIAEEKFDGMRAQVHHSEKKVEIYSRDLNEITRSFPEIQNFFKERALPEIVLDGEICVYYDEKIQPFQLLQKRMGLKKPSRKILKELPVLFIAYDLLYMDCSPVFDLPLEQRRDKLEALSQSHRIPLSNQFELNDSDILDELFDRAIAHGNEGLMLKKRGSGYEYGQRGKSWLKVKKPGGTLDTVMMYAHAGSGKRGGLYSDFTLGISVKNDERYEEEFVPIGKAYGGYTDEELKKMNSEIKKLTVERYGPTLGLIPGLMVELEFDDIQINKRTKAGYTLRLPRFKRIRWDLKPEDADTLKEVERLYKTRVEKERLVQGNNPSFYFNSKND